MKPSATKEPFLKQLMLSAFVVARVTPLVTNAEEIRYFPLTGIVATVPENIP